MKRNNYLLLLLFIIFLIPCLLGLFHAGFPVTDDGSWMIIRFASFFTALRHGQFPVRFLMSLNHGYGYPVADFLYPLFMYIGVFIHIFGFDFINTIKIILGGSLVLSGIFCFFWLRKLFTPIAAFVGGLCYVLFPYHLYDVYQRGSIGEVVALAIVPFIFWQIERGNLVLIAIGIACLILAHNTLALLFLPIIIIYMILVIARREERTTRQSHKPGAIASLTFAMTNIHFRNYMLSLFVGLGLSAFFWIPALYDKQFTVFDSVSVSDYRQYFLTTKNFGIVGIFSLMISILGVGYAFKKTQRNDLFFLMLIYIGLFFSLPISSFLWKLLPLPQLVQFPFRFLSIAILGTAFFIAFMIDSMKTFLKIVIVVFCLFLMYVSSWAYLLPKTYQLYPDSYYSTNQDTTTVKNEYMPKWVKQIPLAAAQSKVAVVKGQASISDIQSTDGDKVQFTTHVSQHSTIRINILYYPGWNVFVNNKLSPFSYSNPQGVIEVTLPAGDYVVTARFGETQIRAISDFIMLLSVLVLGWLTIKEWERFKKAI